MPERCTATLLLPISRPDSSCAHKSSGRNEIPTCRPTSRLTRRATARMTSSRRRSIGPVSEDALKPLSIGAEQEVRIHLPPAERVIQTRSSGEAISGLCTIRMCGRTGRAAASSRRSSAIAYRSQLPSYSAARTRASLSSVCSIAAEAIVALERRAAALIIAFMD
jgi:hypothetical protein